MHVPTTVDRLIVHQFDASRPSPGGIDTCLRGLVRYAPPEQIIAVVGVDASENSPKRLGTWEKHVFGEREIFFMPVARLDPAKQKRVVPHSLRLIVGLLAQRRKMPKLGAIQTHRMDTALLTRFIFPFAKRINYIHTQENGLTHRNSDSFWKWAGGIHRRLEKYVVSSSDDVVVFNEKYAGTVKQWQVNARFSPTWFDPAIVQRKSHGFNHRIVWVGRLERPKDPILAVRTFAALCETEPNEPWALDILGSGTLQAEVEEAVAALPESIAHRVIVHGRVAPADVGRILSNSSLFLMTSQPGYEGFPRVMVEAMASGLPTVATEGSDTGQLIQAGATGFVTTRNPDDMAAAIIRARAIHPEKVRERVASLSAPTVVAELFSGIGI